MPHTLVVFHAHPDDEALLTGGTMAKAAAAGHRVVTVFATDGGAGLAASSGSAAENRRSGPDGSPAENRRSSPHGSSAMPESA